MGTILKNVTPERSLKYKRKPGLAKKFRRLRFKEWMNAGVTQDVIDNSPEAPDHVKSALKEVFGDRCAKLKLAIHPLFKRWALWERCQHEGRVYFVPISVFFEPTKPGYLPSDLKGRHLDHLEGQIGDWRMPHKQDFVIIERFDVKKYGADAINKMLSEEEQARLAATQKDFDNDVEAFHLDNFWLAMRDAQDHYSQPWSTREVEVKKDPFYWKITKKNGYTIREKIYGEEGNQNGLDAIARGETDGAEYAHEDTILDAINGTESSGRQASKAGDLQRGRDKDSDLLRKKTQVEQKQSAKD